MTWHSEECTWGGESNVIKTSCTTNVITTFKKLNLISIIDGGKSMAFVILFFVQVLCCTVMGLCYMLKG